MIAITCAPAGVMVKATPRLGSGDDASIRGGIDVTCGILFLTGLVARMKALAAA